MLTDILLPASSQLRKLRSDPSLLFARILPYVSFLCIVAGAIWLFLLPLDEYSRRTYISENALLPGQVHTYFAGSEQNVFRGFKKELEGLLTSESETSSGYAFGPFQHCPSLDGCSLPHFNLPLF
jgi:hypothetical protein